MTYARSRLWLGISGVGTTVALALLTIGTGWPTKVLPVSSTTPMAVHLAHLAGVAGLHVLLFLVLDLVGGVVIVRQRPSVGRWLGSWLRGALVLAATALVAAALVMTAARAGGNGGAVGVAVLFALALLWGNGWLARAVAPVVVAPATDPVRKAALRAGIDATRIRLVTAGDAAFTGGWVGPAGRTLWLPEHWVRSLAPDELAAQLARRAAVRVHRWRGVAAALLWNGVGFAMALQAPGGGATSAAALTMTSAWFVLWQFAGLLLLPSLSRPAVLEADAVAAVRVGADATYRAIARLDEWQEGESSRPDAVETIFHPVPELRERAERLKLGAAAGPLPPGCYHATRTMLASGWAFTGLLGRAVHCNLGRPALWVVFPSD